MSAVASKALVRDSDLPGAESYYPVGFPALPSREGAFDDPNSTTHD